MERSMDNTYPEGSEGGREAELDDLVARAMDGDGDAKQELLRRYRPLLAHVVRRSYANRRGNMYLFDAEDLWQEARYAFLLLLHRYSPTRRIPFGGYLRSSLPWHFHQLQRQANRQIFALGDGEAYLTIADPREDIATALLFHDLLRGLSPRQMQVLEDLYLHDKSAAEVARARGVTTRAVNATRLRAEDELRTLLVSRAASTSCFFD